MVLQSKFCTDYAKIYSSTFQTFSPRRPGDLELCITEWSKCNAVCWCYGRYKNAWVFSHSTQNVWGWRYCQLCRYLLG